MRKSVWPVTSLTGRCRYETEVPEGTIGPCSGSQPGFGIGGQQISVLITKRMPGSGTGATNITTPWRGLQITTSLICRGTKSLKVTKLVSVSKTTNVRKVGIF